MPEHTRQLAAIMFTDIVGYTVRMGEDSAKTLELVRVSKKIQKPLVEKHNGRWLKEMGDGALVQFNSALDAVNCALEIQRASRADFEADFRIGIHLGDITLENKDVYGDGVNVASRLESIADPGGIYISESIEKAIRGQSDVQAKYLGEIKLKNVTYDVRTYALQGVGLPVPNLDKEKGISGRFIADLQRRGVIRAAITYVILSLLLILLVPYLKSIIKLPDWTITSILVILGAGFPIAIYLAWNYEHSPDGFIKTSSRASWQNPYPTSRRKPFTGSFLITLLILVIVIMFLYPNSTENSGENNREISGVMIDDKSIAVLPFENLSNDPDQDYFTDGVMDEILMNLFKIGDLKVRSRTSVMGYKGTTKNVKKIAQELGVTHILEGSVQRSAEKVRITVQLIDAIKDEHLWAEKYDRNLNDVFAIQSEIAQQIANSLKAQISPEVKHRIETIPTNNSEAYDLFLKGREQNGLFYSEFSVSYIYNGIDYFNQAIALDPEYSNAYAGLAQSYWELAQFSPDYDPKFWEQSKKYSVKAIELDPENGFAYAQLAEVQYKWDWDKKSALHSFKKAIELDPGNAKFHNGILWFYFRTNDCVNLEKESKIISSLQNSEYDPVRYFFINICRRNLNPISALNPGDYESLTGPVMMYQGKYKEFIKYVNEGNYMGPDNLIYIGIQGEAYALSGDTLKARQVIKNLADLSKKRFVSKLNIVPIYLALGEREEAFRLLEKALEERDFAIHCMKEFYVTIYRVQDNPRFTKIMERSWIPQD